MGSTVILDLMGGIALLLWGLHMVYSGVVRAFGADLRRLLGIALQSRPRAFLAGAFVTALLQSSTATGLMTASFVTAGTMDLVPALAVMLGANVGTTLVVQILSFNIAVVTPVLLLSGVIAFKRGGRTRTRDLGRVVIGIGLMLLALHIFLGTLITTDGLPVSRALLGAITGQPIVCLLIVAAMTWAAHSSVAVVLVVMSLGAAHLVSPTAVLAMVLGANVGSALNPLIETGIRSRTRSSATSRTPRASRRTFTPHSTYCSQSFSSAPSISSPRDSNAGCRTSRRQRTKAPRSISTPPRPALPPWRWSAPPARS